MKKLIKSRVCGTYEQCIYALFTNDRSTVAAEEKKKKKRENANAARLSAIQTYTKPLISHVKKKTNFVNFDQISQSYHIIYIYLYIKPKPLLSPQFSISTLLKLNK